jgi:hypothetical protein
MHDKELTIRFGGDGNINIDTLTEFLNNYKKVLYQINHEYGYSSEDLIIEVSPPEMGSFRIRIAPKYQTVLINSIAGIVTATLSGLIIYHSTKEDDKYSLKQVKEILELHKITDDKIPENVYNDYQKNETKQIVNQSFIVVNNDPNITGLQIKTENQQIINLNKKEITQVIEKSKITEIEEFKKEIIEVDEQVLIIKTKHFEGKGKWGFIFRGYPIKALIKDYVFLDKLSVEPFVKGDSLKVILSRKKVFDETLGTFIVNQGSYTIENVISHKSKLINNQGKLEL